MESSRERKISKRCILDMATVLTSHNYYERIKFREREREKDPAVCWWSSAVDVKQN